MEDIKPGDLVAYKSGAGVLACGSGYYMHAVVASINPFRLVSTSGDMMWTATVEIENFEKTGEADRETLLAVLDRFSREYK